MHVLDAAATRAALPFAALIPALARMFAAGCEVPPRHVHQVGAGLVSLVMPAWLPDRYYGVKVVNVAAGNAARGLPGVLGSYQLFDATTGAPLAMLDGGELTARRTAAASALAASRLARADARRLLVVGAGAIAALAPHALGEVLPIAEVEVWARRAGAAQALAARLRADGLDARAATDLAEAAARADIVSCATHAFEPLLRGEWLAPGVHLDLVGSFTPAMRECDDGCFAGAHVWIDTDEALAKSGELLAPLASGALSRAQLKGTLRDLCVAPAPVLDASARTIFKSVGTALEDLAAAILAAEGQART